MHELSIAENILEIVRQRHQPEGDGVVQSVKVRIGDLAGVVPDSLEFCFQAITQGTPYQQTSLLIERVALRGTCTRCGETAMMDEVYSPCPNCGTAPLSIIAGRELQVVEFTLSNEKGDASS